ncbi:MAG: class A beta-lactamase [Chthoniobacterales bacterium]
MLTASVFSLTCACLPLRASAPACAKTQQASVNTQLTVLETSAHGEIGVAALTTKNNKRIDYRAEERFPVQSTCKVMVVAAILKKSMSDPDLLQQRIMYKKSDLHTWDPITKDHLAGGMTINDLCAAAIMWSDNTAANLLIKKLGGPKAVTAFARSIGDNTFCLDGYEYNLNSNPHNLKDTSTPAAMAKSLQYLTLGKALAPLQRKQLVTWMKNDKVGNTCIRAAVPKSWIVADKTGSGDFGVRNDIGLLWPPTSAPIVLAIYFHTFDKKDTVRHDDVIVAATRIILAELGE